MIPVRASRFASIVAHFRGWLPLLILPPATLAIAVMVTPRWAMTTPRWATMWALSVAIFAGCKWLTWRRAEVKGASLGRHAGYLFAWPGLDAQAFLGERLAPDERPTRYEVAGAFCRLLAGVALLWGVARLLPSESELLVGWVGMIGLILTLHFGSFHLLSCFWRASGVVARPLMNRPLRSTSLTEFWGKRWNTAFRDLTHRFLFRPLTKRFGPRASLAIGFLFSGLVHDLVISVPAGGGYGGPTLYFLLQGAGLFVERSTIGRALGLGQGWRGRLFTAATLVLPVGLLFHPPFVTQVIVPFMRAMSAI